MIGSAICDSCPIHANSARWRANIKVIIQWIVSALPIDGLGQSMGSFERESERVVVLVWHRYRERFRVSLVHGGHSSKRPNHQAKDSLFAVVGFGRSEADRSMRTKQIFCESWWMGDSWWGELMEKRTGRHSLLLPVVVQLSFSRGNSSSISLSNRQSLLLGGPAKRSGRGFKVLFWICHNWFLAWIVHQRLLLWETEGQFFIFR